MSPPLTIPAIIVPQAAGVAIKAGLPATGRVHRNTARPGDARCRLPLGDDLPRVRARRLAPPHRRPEHQLPERRRAGGRGLERLPRDHVPHEPGDRRPGGPARLRPVGAVRGLEGRPRLPAAAVLPQHGAPAVHLRQHQDERLAATGRHPTSLSCRTASATAGPRRSGTWRGISSRSTASTRTRTGPGTRAGTTARSST